MPGGFAIDEAPLRQWVLKAYQENRKQTGAPKRALDAVRQFLSGAPGGSSLVARYWLEEDPEASSRSFVEDLERTAPGLAAAVFSPLLTAVKNMEQGHEYSLVPNLSVYVSGLAGPVAIKAAIDESLAGAVIAAAILGLSRVGRGPIEAALGQEGLSDPRHLT